MLRGVWRWTRKLCLSSLTDWRRFCIWLCPSRPQDWVVFLWCSHHRASLPNGLCRVKGSVGFGLNVVFKSICCCVQSTVFIKEIKTWLIKYYLTIFHWVILNHIFILQIRFHKTGLLFFSFLHNMWKVKIQKMLLWLMRHTLQFQKAWVSWWSPLPDVQGGGCWSSSSWTRVIII